MFFNWIREEGQKNSVERVGCQPCFSSFWVGGRRANIEAHPPYVVALKQRAYLFISVLWQQKNCSQWRVVSVLLAAYVVMFIIWQLLNVLPPAGSKF